MFHLRNLCIMLTVMTCFLQSQGADKYSDENRPYEFGFNIEGEQHRHEKKDENGLIMGEFGFWTADDVYHVTVYATDENGNFKILSMKNIRRKLHSAAPERKGQSLPFPPSQQAPVTQGPQQQKPISIQPPAKSCSHCSIPTTTQSPQLTDFAVVSRDNPEYNNVQYPENPQNYPEQNYVNQPAAQNYPQQDAQQQNLQPGERNPKQFDIPQEYNQQPQQVPDKPTLVYAQMQIVDKNTDIHQRGPGEKEGLPPRITKQDMKLLLYTFNYTVGFHGHHEEGYTDGSKTGYYFITGRNGIRTRVDYVADENGFRPKISQEVLDLLSEDVPKPETEKEEKYGLKGYEFKWIYYPVDSKRR